MTDDCSTSAVPLFWRTLEERADSEQFRAAVEREFALETPIWDDLPSRRQFLQSLGAMFALTGLAGCVRRPDETIVPQVELPEQRVPGRLQVFATTRPQPRGSMGVLVTSHEGRPIKIEGNPLHPASGGATDAITQASILDLYDPDRSQVVRRGDEISYFGSFLSELKPRIEQHQERRGAGFRIVTGPTTSPTLLHQLSQLLEMLPEAHWHVSENLSEHSVFDATKAAFGDELQPLYQIDKADVVFCLDADLFGHGPDKVRLMREFGERRRTVPSGERMLRLYVAESTPTQTGAAADHRLPLRPSQLPGVLTALAQRLGIEVPGKADDTGLPGKWLDVLASDLQSAGERALVAVGPSLPPAIQALGYAINDRLGSLHSTLTLRARTDHAGDRTAEPLSDLVTAMQAGDMETLLILEANPAYGTPFSADFVAGLDKVEWSGHCGLYFDETAGRCTWHVPTPHYLEAWSDARHSDGTASLVQPLIAPLYNSQSPHHILDQLLSPSPRTAYDIVRSYWRDQWGKEVFDQSWGQSLHDGIIADSTSPPPKPSLRSDWSQSLEWSASPSSKGDWEIVIRPDSRLHEGEYANNAWLQELPQPFTTQTWGNAAWISPSDASRMNWKSGDVVEISVNQRSVRLPVCIVPGQTLNVCTLHLGYGRQRAGRHGNNVGTNVSPLQTADNLRTIPGATLTATGAHQALAVTQPHQFMENRDLIRTITQDELAHGHTPGRHGHHHHGSETFYPDQPAEGPQWGMVIDLGSCVGCNACVVACQVENNIPYVGPEQVRNSRRMHWLRIDTYYSGEADTPDVFHQPVMCMHCEHAPCEPVCPVAATTHSRDGLNEMTYNRCIGTRYCSNNCPYKVRRFNFLDYHRDLKELPVLQLQPNPDVTVRSRGVMEKCTYCVQRIRRAGIEAQVDGRALQDGDVVTACQQACPTGSIVFGDITDKNSRVAQQKTSPLNYGLLADLNTRPRTTYHAAVRNPHPDLMAQETTG